MPIYAYRCEHCGFQKDVLQKMSDPLLVTCPSCGEPAFKKQVTAAGFQLKGSGWYVTDFRNPVAKEAPKKSTDEAAAPATSETKAADSPPAATDSAAPAPAPAPSKSETPPAKPASGSGAT
jgi:putative FmdB family regulatory protein